MAGQHAAMSGNLDRRAIGLREVMFQSITSMAPAGAVATSIALGAGYAGGALPLSVLLALVVGGRYDECTPGHLAEMASRIAGSQLEIIENASHLCFAEQPGIFAA